MCIDQIDDKVFSNKECIFRMLNEQCMFYLYSNRQIGFPTNSKHVYFRDLIFFFIGNY